MTYLLSVIVNTYPTHIKCIPKDHCLQYISLKANRLTYQCRTKLFTYLLQIKRIRSRDTEFLSSWRLWAEIEVHKWRDLELNLSKTVEELRQDSQLIQANSMKKLRDNKKLLECSFAQI